MRESWRGWWHQRGIDIEVTAVWLAIGLGCCAFWYGVGYVVVLMFRGLGVI